MDMEGFWLGDDFRIIAVSRGRHRRLLPLSGYPSFREKPLKVNQAQYQFNHGLHVKVFHDVAFVLVMALRMKAVSLRMTAG